MLANWLTRSLTDSLACLLIGSFLFLDVVGTTIFELRGGGEQKNLIFYCCSHFHHSNTLVYFTRLLRPPKCIWGTDYNWRWWGHLMTILCNRTCSNFLNCKTMGNEKLKFSLSCSLTHSLTGSHFHHSNTLMYLTHLLRPPHVYWVLIAIGGGGDICWQFYVIDLVRTFWTVRRWEMKNLNFCFLTHSLTC